MGKAHKLFLAILLLSALAPGLAQAQNYQSPSSGQLEFASAYAAASRQSGLEAFWNLVHPKALHCQSLEHRELLDLQIYQQLIEKPVPENFSVRVTHVSEPEAKAVYEKRYGPDVPIPVLPQYAIAIEYLEPQGACDPRKMVRIIYIAENNGRWLETLPCPKELYLTREKMQALMIHREIRTDIAIMLMRPSTKEEVNRYLFYERHLPAAMQVLTRRENIEPEIASRIIEKICLAGPAGKKNAARKPRL